MFGNKPHVSISLDSGRSYDEQKPVQKELEKTISTTLSIGRSLSDRYIVSMDFFPEMILNKNFDKTLEKCIDAIFNLVEKGKINARRDSEIFMLLEEKFICVSRGKAYFHEDEGDNRVFDNISGLIAVLKPAKSIF